MVIMLCIVLVITLGVLGYFWFNQKEEVYTPATKKVAPRLYQACDEDSCIYVLGTIHVGDTRISHLTDSIWKAYQESDALALEIDILKSMQEEDLNSYFLKDDDTIKNYLSDEQYVRLTDFCKKHLLSIELLERMNLSSLYSILENWMYLEMNLSANYGVDMQLAIQAQTDHKELLELESYEFQENLLNSFSDEFYKEQVDTMLKHFNYEKGETRLLYDAYLSGNAWLLKQMLGTTRFAEPEEQDYQQKMIIDRNIQMSAKAEQYLQDNKKVFIAVGAAHVLGDKGIIESLQAKGYQVTLVQ